MILQEIQCQRGQPSNTDRTCVSCLPSTCKRSACLLELSVNAARTRAVSVAKLTVACRSCMEGQLHQCSHNLFNYLVILCAHGQRNCMRYITLSYARFVEVHCVEKLNCKIKFRHMRVFCMITTAILGSIAITCDTLACPSNILLTRLTQPPHFIPTQQVSSI